MVICTKEKVMTTLAKNNQGSKYETWNPSMTKFSLQDNSMEVRLEKTAGNPRPFGQLKSIVSFKNLAKMLNNAITF